MKSISKQRGMSTMGLLLVLLIAAFFLMSAFKLLPIYMENWTVRETIERAVNQGELNGKSPAAMREALRKTLELNNVEVIKAKDIRFKQEDHMTKVDASYEARVPLIFNIDVVVKFEDLIFDVNNSRAAAL